MTLKIKRSIHDGNIYDDSIRTEKFAVIFAKRYTDTFDNYINKNHNKITNNWRYAFHCASDNNFLLMQHIF